MVTKEKIWLSLLTLVFLLFGVGFPGYGVNILQNPGFESLNAKQEAEAWRVDFWSGGSGMGLTTQKVHRGTYAAIIESTKENDARFVQKVNVEPNSVYRLSAWVATLGVPATKIGATLCVMGGFVYSNEIKGDRDWQPIELVFRTLPRQTQITIGLRLGFYSNTTRGTVYFDDVSLEKITQPVASCRDLERETLKFNADAARPMTLYYPKTFKTFLVKMLAFFDYPFWIVVFYLLLLYGMGFVGTKELAALQPKLRLGKNLPLFLGGLALLAVLIRLPLLSAIPFQTDMGNFKAWTLRITDTGPLFFYKSGYYCDYPPFSLYVLWLVGGLVKLLGLGSNEALFNAAVKLPALLCDLGTAWLILTLTRKKNLLLGLILAGIYLILPPVIYNSAYWGQMDTYYVLMVLGAFYLIVKKREPEWAAALVTASLLTKAQTIAFIPLFLLYLFLNFDWKRWVSTIGTALGAFILIILPFNLRQSIGWIVDLYTKQAGLYPFATLNAGNFLALLNGNNQADNLMLLPGITYALCGYVLFFVSLVWCGYFYWRKRTTGSFLVALTMIAFAFFMFFPRMHERYLFPVFALFLLTYAFYKDRRLFYIGSLLGIGNLLNMHAVILKFQNALNEDTFQRIIYIIGLVNTVLFVVAWSIFQLQLGKQHRPIKKKLGQYNALLRQSYLGKLSRAPFRLRRLDYGAVSLFALVYCCLIFFRLGTTQTPATGVDLTTPQAGVEVVFSRPVNLKTVIWYDAEGTGKLKIETEEDGVWRNLGLFDCENYYVLKRQALAARKVGRLKITPQNSAGHINEIGFLDAEDRLIPIKKVISLSNGKESSPAQNPLFDEQTKILATPSYLNSTYFDEIYHGRTAYEFVKRTTVYETTHPPLGKDLLALGVMIFGMNPFGMRVVHVVIGICLIVALFFLGRQILATRFGAYATMLIGFLDFMPFVQSRYATIDSTSVLFITLMLIFAFKYLREQLQGDITRKSRLTIVLVIFFFALAASVKWTAPYGLVGIAVSVAVVKIRQYLIVKQIAAQEVAEVAAQAQPDPEKALLKQVEVSPANELLHSFWRRNFGGTVLRWLLFFVLIALPVYYLTYIPFLRCQGITRVISKEAATAVWQNQKGMLDYHANLTATHPFSSNWWSWPFNFKPLWLYMGSRPKPGHKASIVTLGNPVIWFCCGCAFVILLYQFLVNRRFSLLHLVFLIFLSLYLPWMLVNRATFIYHFYPALPLYYILLACILEPLWQMGKHGRGMVGNLVLLAAVVWLIYSPVLIGVDIPEKYMQALRLFPRDWLF
ncbi:MAG: phospholipid carrier-dependent glycosyltransferase [Bacillota bacterium]|jgi:Gpi18-like mannosyltransferase